MHRELWCILQIVILSELILLMRFYRDFSHCDWHLSD